MASCCQNVVTPRMIKAGQVSIGDKIQLEEEAVSVQGPAATEESVPVQGHISMNGPSYMNEQAYLQNQANMQERMRMENLSNMQEHRRMENQTNMQAHMQNHSNMQQSQGISGIPGGVINLSGDVPYRTINYSQMTPYMNNVAIGGTMENPSVTVPQSPLTPNGYQEEIDSSALQSFNGFLRTQIGRYVRIEQLVTSDRTEDRLGFLVGVGSNFIILQDISTGNILVIDIFSIRLTYVYYSPAIVPSF